VDARQFSLQEYDTVHGSGFGVGDPAA